MINKAQISLGQNIQSILRGIFQKFIIILSRAGLNGLPREKPVFGISTNAMLKEACSATETG